VIDSMTRQSASIPCLKAARKSGLPPGAGVKVEEVNKRLKSTGTWPNDEGDGFGKARPLAASRRRWGFGGSMPRPEQMSAGEEKNAEARSGRLPAAAKISEGLRQAARIAGAYGPQGKPDPAGPSADSGLGRRNEEARSLSPLVIPGRAALRGRTSIRTIVVMDFRARSLARPRNDELNEHTTHQPQLWQN